MAEIAGLLGWRYNPERVRDLGEVTTPPYDVISPAAQAAHLARDPHNFIRLELPTEDPARGLDKYQHAAATLRNWMADGVLIHEDMPSLYIYEQTFTVGEERFRRLGFISQVRLEPWAAGVILPHERTLSKPKADRMALMEATQAQLSPVFALYEDGGDLAELVRSATQSQPHLECTDEDGVEHRVWIRSAASLVHEIREALSIRTVVIADGHHRYETALAFRDARLAAGDLPDDHPARFMLMMLVSMADPGLVVLPTHRVLFGLPEGRLASLPEALAAGWEVEPVPHAELAGRLAGSEGDGVFGLATPESAVLLRVRDWSAVDAAMPGASDAYRRLDVAILHRCLLEGVLGIDQAAQAAQSNLRYVKDAAEAIRSAQGGDAQAVFLLRPTRVDQLVAVAKAGEVMPQKSTFFYPKLRSGLVFHGLGEAQGADGPPSGTSNPV